MSNTLKRAAIVVAVFVVAATAASAFRAKSDNRPSGSGQTIQTQSGMSNALASVLNRSCGDCHSNTMVSGWYTRVPPFSTLLARGAKEGRKAVNFAEWNDYSSEQQRALLLASCKDAKLGKMPVSAYVRVRSDARLSTQDIETICSAASHFEATTAVSAARKDP